MDEERVKQAEKRMKEYVGRKFRVTLEECDGIFSGHIAIEGRKEDFIVGKMIRTGYEYASGLKPGELDVIVRQYEPISETLFVEVARESLDELKAEIDGIPKKLVKLSAPAEIDAEISELRKRLSNYPCYNKNEENRVKKYSHSLEEHVDDAKRLIAKMSRA